MFKLAHRAICFTSYLLPGKLRKSISRVLEMWKHLKGHLKQWLISPYGCEESCSRNTKQTDITVLSMLFICTWTGFWACWGTLGVLGSTGPPSCSCWPLGTSIGGNGLPWLGRNSCGPWGPKGPASWGFKFTTCGVSNTSGCCCCSTYWGNNEDAWRRRELFQFAYLIWWRNAHNIIGNRLPVPVLVQELPELVHSVSGSEHT